MFSGQFVRLKTSDSIVKYINLVIIFRDLKNK